MKTILILALSTLSTAAVAQKKVSIRKSIDDDGSKMTIKISGNADGKRVDYYNVFDVRGMSKSQRYDLQKHVMDSLELTVSPVGAHPAPPAPPSGSRRTAVAAPVAPTAPAAPAEPAKMTASSEDQANVEIETEEVTSNGGKDYYKKISWDKRSGKLEMQYRFQKDGNPKNYEKAIDATGSSKEKRKQLVREFEDSIGFSAGR